MFIFVNFSVYFYDWNWRCACHHFLNRIYHDLVLLANHSQRHCPKWWKNITCTDTKSLLNWPRVWRVQAKMCISCSAVAKVKELALGGKFVIIFLVFLFFSDETGNSWCPYCVRADPVIKEALKQAAENSHFIHVEVGDRP